MPTISAASRFCAIARMARPNWVNLQQESETGESGERGEAGDDHRVQVMRMAPISTPSKP